jgi:hypothetical protein
MKNLLAAILAGALLGVGAASLAKLPPTPPKSDAEKKAEAEKAAAAKAKDAADLAKAQERAVANYKKTHRAGDAVGADHRGAVGADDRDVGADHSRPMSSQHELTPREAETAMPMPGQANDHSSPARGSEAGRR